MRVYLDHNATTPLRPESRARLVEVTDSLRGNASSLHAAGRHARSVVDEARGRVADALSVSEDEIFFTSGGTEANNLALFGSLEAPGSRHGLLTTAVEHSSVLDAARAWEGHGNPLGVVAVDERGRIDLHALATAAREGSWGLVSVMAANNEVGSLSDLIRIGSLLEERGDDRPRFHTDAVQALGRVPVRLQEWGVDLASFSAHKVGGPVGVGVLWCRTGVSLIPRSYGGGQERDLRPGTENVAGIAAAAVAIELAVEEQENFARETSELCRFLWKKIRASNPNAILLGPALDEPRLPNTLSVLLPGSDGKVLVTRLDLEGLEVSAGSACASGSVEPSHVLIAMGLDTTSARSGVRISLGRTTTRSECEHAADVLKKLFVASRAT